jgi:hypothetical protein
MSLTVEQHEERAREFLSPYWAFADVHPEYPASTGTVVKLMIGLQYVVDAAAVREIIDRGKMVSPRARGGKLHWMAADIVELMGQLEDGRKWAPLSPRHQHKKTRWEIHRELAAAGQAPPVFNDLDQFSAEDLLRHLVEADQREVRELLHTAILIKIDEFQAAWREKTKRTIRKVSAQN